MLTDTQRKRIHDLALDARVVLTREAREVLEGTYGVYADGRVDAPQKLPQVQADAETRAIYERVVRFLDDEAQAGLPRAEAVAKLVKEVAFTHLNRLVAFKMLEARKLIRGTLDKGLDANAFKFYLADPAHAADLALYERGEADAAYRRFLLWQSGQVAQEVRVLFDPDALPGLLFPRPRALRELLALLNAPTLAEVWLADETVGWVYQYFNEPELQAAFEKVRVSSAKFEARDIPSATQLFTPNWIVRFLVHNTLGRLWADLHPDTKIDLRFMIDDLRTEADKSSIVNRKSKIVKEITLLDPACGGMHFGLVAFDVFAAMYEEELARAGEPGWPETPSVDDASAIPAAILEHNLFGIDIDLRAVQLSALALYLKAKSWQDARGKRQEAGSAARQSKIVNRQSKIVNLACADIAHFSGAALGEFVRAMRFERPIYERLMLKLWDKLQDVSQLGSLLRLEQELAALIEAERTSYEKKPLFAGLPGEFERAAAEKEFWGYLSTQIIQGLDEFARRQAQAGVDQTFFTGEATKGLRLAELMLRRYDVVVTNPPYLSRRKMNAKLADLVGTAYPEGKSDFYAAFIQRCLEFAEDDGYVGMLTMHSFMFISSYESLRQTIRGQAVIDALAHCGPGLFEVGNPGTLQTAAFTLRKETDAAARETHEGTYIRLVHAPNGDAKRLAFEQALQDGSSTYRVPQRAFDAIPGSPWVYWIPYGLRNLFETLPKLGDISPSIHGTATYDNFRFLRLWWEVGLANIGQKNRNWRDFEICLKSYVPYMKGGGFKRWYGNQEIVLQLLNRGRVLIEFLNSKRDSIRGSECIFHEGITYSFLTSSTFSARISPGGFIFDVAGSSLFPEKLLLTLAVMNSTFAGYALKLINPTVNFQVGDLARLPIVRDSSARLETLTREAITCAKARSAEDETTYDFIAPPRWDTGPDDPSPGSGQALAAAEARLAALERQIDDEVYRLYSIGDADRAAIEAELAGGSVSEGEDEAAANLDEDDEEGEAEAAMTREELAVRWISYAVGIVLGRFTIGDSGIDDLRLTIDEEEGSLVNRKSKIVNLGSAIYRQEDFAVGSLPMPDETEFDQLVGPAERFAYVDEAGGRHLFPADVEAALRALTLEDGIAVFDEGHPRDLPALVEKALELMIDDLRLTIDEREIVNRQSKIVIQLGANGDLRQFLERDFFTKWHLRWYRKRPVYWPLQSARRSYGFVLFHERVNRMMLYVLMRDYMDYFLNGLQQQIDDRAARLDGLSGRDRKQVEHEIARLAQTLEEVQEFAKTMARLAREGYEPAPDWIDDGVILRLAPLWELIPIWKAEPRKYWERLARGDYDWSHIAMHYWPDRVKAACKVNKSFAIAHRIDDF